MMDERVKTRELLGFPDLKSTRVHLNELREIFSAEDRLLILIKPDPDSIASSLALKTLLLKSIRYATTAYDGEITRQENMALIRLLSIPMERMRKLILPSSIERLSWMGNPPTSISPKTNLSM